MTNLLAGFIVITFMVSIPVLAITLVVRFWRLIFLGRW